jgi:hypothetical protein
LNNLGHVILGSGDASVAYPMFRESLLTNREIGLRGGIGWVMTGLAGVAAAQG